MHLKKTKISIFLVGDQVVEIWQKLKCLPSSILGIESNSPIFPPKFTAPSGDFVVSIFSIIYVETKISWAIYVVLFFLTIYDFLIQLSTIFSLKIKNIELIAQGLYFYYMTILYYYLVGNKIDFYHQELLQHW